MNFNISSEKEFSHWLMKGLNKAGHAQRIETSTGSGIPDINWCQNGLEVWIETKIGCSNAILLRKEQYAWGMRRWVKGKGDVRVMGYCPVHDEVSIWRFPFMVQVFGKYLVICDLPLICGPRTKFKFI